MPLGETIMKWSIVVLALVAPPLVADEVHLKGGGRLTGEIVEQTAENITVDIGAGRMTVKMSTVVRIDKSASPLQEYRTRAAALADQDVEGWRELARWASNQGLGTQAREAYTHVTAVVPDDAEANRGLGLVQQDGRWMTEEESYLARGFVKFEGEWMNPGREAGDPRGAPGERRGGGPGARRPDAGRPGGGAGTGGPGGRRRGRVLGRLPAAARRSGLLGGLRLHADALARATDSAAGTAGRGAEMKRLRSTGTPGG